jgi:hypothetical protein
MTFAKGNHLCFTVKSHAVMRAPRTSASIGKRFLHCREGTPAELVQIAAPDLMAFGHLGHRCSPE